MGKMRFLEWDHSVKRDVWKTVEVDYDPTAYTTKEGAARGMYEALKKVAVTLGHLEEEVQLFEPTRTEKYCGTREWCVVWEEGPYQWAIGLSMEVHGPWGYCEPHYSFDLCFTG